MFEFEYHKERINHEELIALSCHRRENPMIPQRHDKNDFELKEKSTTSANSAGHLSYKRKGTISSSISQT